MSRREEEKHKDRKRNKEGCEDLEEEAFSNGELVGFESSEI